MAELIAADTAECDEEGDARGSGDGYLLCTLPAGHDGLHWDGFMNMTWKRGKPDA